MAKITVSTKFFLALSILAGLGALSCGREPASSPEPTSVSASGVASVPTGGLKPPPVPKGLEPLPESAFRVEWGKPKLPAPLRAGQVSPVTISVKNPSDSKWPSKGSLDPGWAGAGAVRLSYRWMKPPSKPITPFFDRIDLPNPLAPGESVELTASIKGPAKPGDYELQFDLVQESVAWFGDKKATRLTIPVKVD